MHTIKEKGFRGSTVHPNDVNKVVLTRRHECFRETSNQNRTLERGEHTRCVLFGRVLRRNPLTPTTS